MPVVSGVAYASLKELTFTWLSFWCAMASNVVCAARGVVVKVNQTYGVGKRGPASYLNTHTMPQPTINL